MANEGKILELVNPKILIPAIEKFVAKDNFIVNINPGVKILYLGGNFCQWFLDKIEENILKTKMSSRKLLKWLEDAEIIAGVGGETLAETQLAQVYHLMSQQPNGEDGVLLTNGYANVFYVRDANGVLRAMGVYWHGGGWIVFARAVGGYWCRGGRLAISRSSC